MKADIVQSHAIFHLNCLSTSHWPRLLRYGGLSPKKLNSIPPLTPMVQVLWSFVSCQKTELHTRWVQSLAKKCSIVHQESALSLDARENHVAAQRLSFNCFSSSFGYLAPNLFILTLREQLWFWHCYLQVVIDFKRLSGYSWELFIKYKKLFKNNVEEISGRTLCIEPREGCL